jgi:hypothetical protein
VTVIDLWVAGYALIASLTLSLQVFESVFHGERVNVPSAVVVAVVWPAVLAFLILLFAIACAAAVAEWGVD